MIRVSGISSHFKKWFKFMLTGSNYSDISLLSHFPQGLFILPFYLVVCKTCIEKNFTKKKKIEAGGGEGQGKTLEGKMVAGGSAV